MTGIGEYDNVRVGSATVLTFVPHTEDPEFRRYEAGSVDELASILTVMNVPQHAETVINVEIGELD